MAVVVFEATFISDGVVTLRRNYTEIKRVFAIPRSLVYEMCRNALMQDTM